ncbi:17673_t:CDS:2 [Entrophospora sp. SA101]|nr:17673_t:CDS:2 [Entrophospora sp. SA101]
MTAGELKAKLEENDPELEVSERTVRRELKNLGYVSILPRKISFGIKFNKSVLSSVGK